MLTELAAPCHMELAVVWGPGATTVDFEWRHADPLAGLALGSGGADLAGQRLRSCLPDQALTATLFEVYQCAFRTRKAQTTIVLCGDWSTVHRVRPSVGGVYVTITNATAAERVAQVQRLLLALERSMQKGETEPPAHAVPGDSKSSQ